MPPLLALIAFLLACTPDPSRSQEGPETPLDPEEAAPPAGMQAEFRGAWITRWSYGAPGDVEQAVRTLAKAGFNAVLFQVRGTFDACYDSPLEPWAAHLGGRLGRDPGWDPLEVAVREGHRHGLQVHAWINVAPLWSAGEPPPEPEAPGQPRHALLAHPEWLVKTPGGDSEPSREGYLFASLGEPAVRSRVSAVTADIVTRYDVDGIHLDYLRYPGPEYGREDARRAGSSLADGDWQREQVLRTARQVSLNVDVPVTAAVWGVYENRWGWADVSEGNRDYYQDTRALLAKHALDAAVPMIYRPVTDRRGARLDFATLLADHVAHASQRHVYAGITAALSPHEVFACIRTARREGAQGIVLFDYATALEAGWLPRLGETLFAEPAAPPLMTWR